MNSEQFIFWLHGFFEISNPTSLSNTQVQEIRNHIGLVLGKPVNQPPLPIAPPSGNFTVCGDKVTTPPNEVVFNTGLLSDQYLLNDNRNKVYITITNEPIFNEKTTYSYYPTNPNGMSGSLDGQLQCSFLKNFGVDYKYDKVYCVVDNKLKPQETKYNGLKTAESNHLYMAGEWPGILNIGNGSPIIC